MLRRNAPTLDADREAFEKSQDIVFELKSFSMKKAASLDELRDTDAIKTLQIRKEHVTLSIQKAINASECAAKEKHVRTAIMGTYQDHGAEMFWHVVKRLPLSTQSVIAWKFCHVLHKLLRDGHPNVLKDSLKYKQQLKDLGLNWSHTPHGYGRLIGSYLKCLAQRMELHRKYKTFPGNLMITDEDLEKIGQYDINAFFELSIDFLDCLEALLDLQRKIFNSLDLSRAVSMTPAGQCRLAPCIPIILDSSQLYDYTVKSLFKLHSCLPADTLSGHRQRFYDSYAKLKKFYYISSNMQYFKRLIQVPLMPEKPPDFLLKSEGNHELGPVKMMPEEDQPPEPDRPPTPEPAIGQLVDTNFDEMFGSMDQTFSFNGIAGSSQTDPRDAEIEMLKAEIAKLKTEIELMQSEHSQEVRRLLDQIKDLQRDLDETQLIAQDAAEDVIKLRKQAHAAELQAEAAVTAESLLHDIEKRALGNEEMYKKLKEKHLALVKDHADLLRKNADTRKVAETLQQSAGENENEKGTLKQEIEELKQKIDAFSNAEKELERKRREEIQRLLTAATDEASEMIRSAILSLDNQGKTRTCSAESLVTITMQTTTELDRMDEEAKKFKETQEIDGLIQSLASFGHWMSETIENGGATCNMAPEEQGAGLETACRNCGKETLKLLDELKQADLNQSCQTTKETLEEIVNAATDLLPKISDIKGGDLHDLVEQEMASTAQAVEQAAERIEAMLNEARQRDSGVNLEVNERILDSCTELMKTIKVLITSSKQLQREIVAHGRGATSSKEFYMKNSRWTEGLISAAKAVGSGATMLTDSADLVIQGNGKFEELMVWSHEISASTAQLVAASRVKASKGSEKLKSLQSASRSVNGATARVVASTNAGRRQLEDANESLTDLANTITLTQIKRKEMDSQVKVLELEQALQQERIRLGALRKKHYELAGVKEDEDAEEDAANTNETNTDGDAPKPTVAPKPTIAPKPIASS